VHCWVLEVHNSPLLGELLVGEIGISFIANSWLAKVDHVSFDTLSTKSGAGELSECGPHAVSCHFELEVRMQCLQAGNFLVEVAPDNVGCLVKS
jgi:hypothetical protein